MKIYKSIFDKIVALENLFLAWDKFKSDKQNKKDVLRFERYLEQNIFQLHRDLINKTYKHGAYKGFFIYDPKKRHIHKATVRDRILHHAVFNILNPIFEPTFIANSFSCRVNKGTHRGVEILAKITRQISKNYNQPCFVLKCDIKKFFDSISHGVLLEVIDRRIKDGDAMWLIKEIIESYANDNFIIKKGLPIGNLTSQLFANIYLNELDQFIKHTLKIKNYVRYTDDFIIVSSNESFLQDTIKPISDYLSQKLILKLHPKKIIIRKIIQGIDFLGYTILPHCRLVRTKTRQRIFKKILKKVSEQSLQSYLGVFSHANAYKLSNELKNQFWLNK